MMLCVQIHVAFTMVNAPAKENQKLGIALKMFSFFFLICAV